AGWNRHESASKLSAPTAIQGGDALADERPSELSDALADRTEARGANESLRMARLWGPNCPVLPTTYGARGPRRRRSAAPRKLVGARQVTSQKHQAWDPPSRSARNRSAETKHRRPDPAFNPPAPPSRSGGGAAGALLATASSAFWRIIRQPRDFTQASYAILEILPEVDSQPSACLLQARKGVPRTPTRVTPRAAADLPFLGVVPDVPLAEVVVQRQLGALEHQQ